MRRALIRELQKRPQLAAKTKRLLAAVGYDYQHWSRAAMYPQAFALIEELGPQQLDVLEISAGERFRKIPFRSYTEANYPDYDVCERPLDQKFDLIIADQVFEHLLWPYRAGRNVYEMLRPGGYFFNATPFLVLVHEIPYDCTRWTETGMRYFLAECGFPLETTRTYSWGNRACVKANFTPWARRGWFGSLKNERRYPVTVWALAQKPQEVSQ